MANKGLLENKDNEIPVTSDIMLLEKFLKYESAEAYQKLENDENVHSNYIMLCKCVLAMAIIFNRKRPGDVHLLTVDRYEQQAPMEEDTEEFVLTDMEKILKDKFERVVTCEKRGKPVPILFPQRL